MLYLISIFEGLLSLAICMFVIALMLSYIGMLIVPVWKTLSSKKLPRQHPKLWFGIGALTVFSFIIGCVYLMDSIAKGSENIAAYIIACIVVAAIILIFIGLTTETEPINS